MEEWSAGHATTGWGPDTKHRLTSDVSKPFPRSNSVPLIKRLFSSNHKAQLTEQIGEDEMLDICDAKQQGSVGSVPVALKSGYLQRLADRSQFLAKGFCSQASKLLRRVHIAQISEPCCPRNVSTHAALPPSTDSLQRPETLRSHEDCCAQRASVDRAADGYGAVDTESNLTPKRVLTTILFTDLVGSTELALKMGDESWGVTVCNHYTLSLAELDRYGGRLIRKTGDGIMAIFDSPTNAVECAQAISRAVKSLGLSVRAGVHSGEVGFDSDGELYGFAAHLAARVCDQAGKDEVFVSRTVRDLVVGSSLRFNELGTRDAKGMTEPLHLYQLDQPKKSSSIQQIREKGLAPNQLLSANLS
ncbi:MAG: adenylate/guanylate cyclase domain-containing protein [Pseudomonadota bacterium]